MSDCCHDNSRKIVYDVVFQTEEDSVLVPAISFGIKTNYLGIKEKNTIGRFLLLSGSAGFSIVRNLSCSTV